MKLANQQKRSTFISGCLHLLLFIVPLGYFALIATVVIHEVVGHGFVALALGGGFDRVTLKWDGMGLAEAYAPLHAPIRDDILVYLGGVASTTIAGILLLLAGLAVRRRLHLRLALLLLAIANLLEGPVYMFWNAYQPTPPGDIGVILAMIGPARVAIVRSVLMLVGGSLSVATTVVLPALLFRTVEEILGNGELLRGWQRAIALALLISLPGVAGWMLFDWNQLAPGVGWLPNYIGAGSMLLVSIALYWCALHPRRFASATVTKWSHLAVAWGLGGATVAAILLWFQNGVTL